MNLFQPPPFRGVTSEVEKALATMLNLPYDKYSQDWPYEVAQPEDIEKYIALYKITTDEDKKFVLMQMLIQATNDQLTVAAFHEYWGEIRELLVKDFTLHAYTIYYWACFDNENLEDCFYISPYMHELWIKTQYGITEKEGNKLTTQELASLLVEDLVDANLLKYEDSEQAIQIVEEKIEMRKFLGDY